MIALIALQGNFAYSFLLGVLAAVNPCGFVLLPTYLLYFLGLNTATPQESQQTSVLRALRVGTAVSSGFVGLFLVVGIITRGITTVIQDNAKYASFVIGLALIAMGIAMLAGWKPRVMTPNIDVRKDHTVRAMFFFGIAYAVASIGCTIGFLTSVILGSINRHGYISGVISVVLYGLGMGLLVTSLTVAIALARGGFIKILRKALPYFDRVSAAFVLLTGLYLTWYWYGAIANKGSDSVTSRVEDWQTTVATRLQELGATKLLIIFALILGIAGFIVKSSRSA